MTKSIDQYKKVDYTSLELNNFDQDNTNVNNDQEL